MQIDIIVRGPPKSGKTLAIRWLYRMLISLGADVSINWGPDGVPPPTPIRLPPESVRYVIHEEQKARGEV